MYFLLKIKFSLAGCVLPAVGRDRPAQQAPFSREKKNNKPPMKKRALFAPKNEKDFKIFAFS
jgi:hypothetical protein